jgi:predicted Zn-dependent protease
VAAAIERGVARETTVSGFLENYEIAQATANDRGLFAYLPTTWLEYTNTIRTPDGRGSGWAGVRLHDAAGLDAAARARVAAEKAVASRTTRPLEPGDHPVILEPTATAVMAGALVGQMNARRAMEGRSYLSAPGGETKLGQRLLAPIVTIETDRSTRRARGRGPNSPARPTVWYRSGWRDAPVRPLVGRKERVDPVPGSTNLVMRAAMDRSGRPSGPSWSPGCGTSGS